MHPAPSVIIFTVLSGAGFGLFLFLGLGALRPTGLAAFLIYALAYGLSVGGLLASAFHLGNPQRALLAFTQWRTSWLSREAWLSTLCLLSFAPAALMAIFAGGGPWALGLPGAALALATVLSTSMIYAQLRTVPRWNHWTTPALFFGFALAGGAIFAGQSRLAALLCLALGALLILAFRLGDARFAARGATLASATRLGAPGRVRQFEPPHTGSNYLMDEMVFRVGRRHARRLRLIAVTLAALLPALALLLLPGWPGAALAAVLHLTGAFATRWLFFAEAEHVVGLYYGR